MHLLQIEWMKIKNYKTFWMLVGLFMLLSALGNYISIKTVSSISEASMNMLTQKFSFPSAWDFVGYTQSWFVIFLVFFVIISIANEFTYRTNRQHIIDGMSRMDFLHSKIMLIAFISIISAFFYIMLSLVVGFSCGGGNPLPHCEKVFYMFIYTFNYCLFAALITFFVRKTGLSIILFFSYVILEGAISMGIKMKTLSPYGNFLPLQTSDELLPSDTIQKIGDLTSASFATISPIIYLLFSLLFIVSYYLILRKKMLSSDL
jgi:ABC-2 type transport system permease protein